MIKNKSNISSRCSLIYLALASVILPISLTSRRDKKCLTIRTTEHLPCSLKNPEISQATNITGKCHA